MKKRLLPIDTEKLTVLRLQKKLTISALATQAGLSRTTVQYAGMTAADGALESTVIKLATALGVEVHDLVKGSVVV